MLPGNVVLGFTSSEPDEYLYMRVMTNVSSSKVNSCWAGKVIAEYARYSGRKEFSRNSN